MTPTSSFLRDGVLRGPRCSRTTATIETRLTTARAWRHRLDVPAPCDDLVHGGSHRGTPVEPCHPMRARPRSERCSAMRLRKPARAELPPDRVLGHRPRCRTPASSARRRDPGWRSAARGNRWRSVCLGVLQGTDERRSADGCHSPPTCQLRHRARSSRSSTRSPRSVAAVSGRMVGEIEPGDLAEMYGPPPPLPVRDRAGGRIVRWKASRGYSTNRLRDRSHADTIRERQP